ncbi:MAG: Xaa-Pro peptidase family protein [Bacillota bacterium]
MTASPAIPPDRFHERRERFRQELRAAGLDGAVVVGRSFYDRPGDLAYLTNHLPPFPASEFTGEASGLGHGALVLAAGGGEILVADHLREDLVAVEDRRLGSDVARLTAEAVRELGLAGRQVALVGSDVLPLAWYRCLEETAPGTIFVPFDEPLRRLRRIKDEDEIEALRRAAAVGEAGLQAALERSRPGASERDVGAAGTAAALAAGADFVRYFRVHTGAWSLRTHRWPPATERAAQDGEAVFLDIIGAAGGYQFDILRTTAAGAPGPELERLLETALAVQDAVLAAVRPGVAVPELFRAAEAAAERAGFRGELGTFMGHGIGLETVEAPLLAASSAAVLEPGMVLCVEPMLRLPGVAGASIEDEIVVRPDGFEWLTRLERRVWAAFPAG